MPLKQLLRKALYQVKHLNLCSLMVPCLAIESADNLTRVPLTGGGVALLYASKELEKLQTANFDQKIGVQIIQNALKVHILFA